MTTQWNPFACQQDLTRQDLTRRWAPADGPDARWWVAPSVCTPALMLSVWLDLSVLSGIGSTPDVAALIYTLPVVLVGVSWLLPHRRSLRAARIGLAASGVGVALMASKVLAMGLMFLFLFVALLCGWNYEG
ncbi:hypothetical protein ACFV98_14355 [Streptomyces violascens]|uniref:hypothetical protein n=1 Tax=Streptomyces violascens TaxID=67381 RepID=UPI0036548BE9